MQRLLKSRVDAGSPGPDAALRERTPTWVWGEARTPDGAVRTARVRTANGYTVTAHAAVGVVRRLLDGGAAAGAATPARLVGARFVETLPGSGPLEIR